MLDHELMNKDVKKKVIKYCFGHKEQNSCSSCLNFRILATYSFQFPRCSSAHPAGIFLNPSCKQQLLLFYGKSRNIKNPCHQKDQQFPSKWQPEFTLYNELIRVQYLVMSCFPEMWMLGIQTAEV